MSKRLCGEREIGVIILLLLSFLLLIVAKYVIIGEKPTEKRSSAKKLPQAIIIGVKKGGTRALLEFLRQHPNIKAPGPEVHFFDKNYHLGLEWYRNQMPSSREGQLTVEKTPSYFIKSSVPKKVYEMSPSTKLILVVRDPVTRAISDYAQLASRWGKDTKSFDRLAFLNDTKIVNASWAVIKIGLYYKHLARWRRYFSDKQIHFVSGEKLVSQPAAEVAKIEKYLGLEPYIHEKHFYFNHTKGFPCLKKKARCLHSSKGRPHPNIDAEVIERLRDFYKPFNYKFYAMTGIDFGW